MVASEVRFGVRAISGRRAASWKAWAEDGNAASDFYVSCRVLGGEMKASFHQSGQWHVSYTKKFHESAFRADRPRPPTRFIDKWTRPPEIAPGFTLPLRILVPCSATTTRAVIEAENVTWVEPAPEGYAIEFALVLTSPVCQVDGWPCKRSMNSQLVGSFRLPSGEHVWIIWTVQPFSAPILSEARGHFFEGKSQRSLLGGGLRGLALSVHTDGSRVLYDVPVETSGA